MELGVGMFGDLHINSKGEVQPAQQRMQELIEEIKLMDEVSLNFFWQRRTSLSPQEERQAIEKQTYSCNFLTL